MASAVCCCLFQWQQQSRAVDSRQQAALDCIVRCDLDTAEHSITVCCLWFLSWLLSCAVTWRYDSASICWTLGLLNSSLICHDLLSLLTAKSSVVTWRLVLLLPQLCNTKRNSRNRSKMELQLEYCSRCFSRWAALGMCQAIDLCWCRDVKIEYDAKRTPLQLAVKCK